ncbi:MULTISPECIES: hypothetical protein [unclassified Corallococcus]|uniref:hypothetical protein n=1 Tax=unclassified Corallococcus TaxID=2685029 RepID=UPI001A8D0734|nr:MULTISPECIES: hypothetical protein [unclassified Corallococcus]MBN9686232.1 hypothetical protein [Corallococcus sp. NCSPR001]WAS82336.1 hypothetical protein O0N60_23760 [Corallococcus sp. NCRR]
MLFSSHARNPGADASVGTEALDAILQGDPVGAYVLLDEDTRARYRAACLEMALASGKSPAQVASAAVQWSGERPVVDPRDRHVGEVLLSTGRRELEVRLGCRIPAKTRVARWMSRHAGPLYVGTFCLLTLLTLVQVERMLAASGVVLLERLILVGLLILPVLALLQEIINVVVWRLCAEPPPLPRLDPDRVLTPETRTLVVTPLLVTRLEDIDAQLRRMELNYQGNVSPELFFALLTDFPDAQAKDLPGEQDLLQHLERGIQALNARQGASNAPRFFLLHRERRWNPVARRWMGWERKRGKLEELNRLLLGAADTSYVAPVPQVLRSVRYVITLDADTQLLPGTAAQLVAVLHHPLNQARFAADGQRVVSGYSMIQPAMESEPTKSAWSASRHPKMSILRRKPKQRSTLSQSAFGVDDFVGKGIYDVKAFSRALEGRIPENLVLSHDKLEGKFSRVAFAPEILLFEARQSDLANDARVWHRWTRGDWQLLPWLLPWVPAHGGRWVSNPLSVLDRWKILADMRYSLNLPAFLVLLTYGWACAPGGGSPWAWTLGGVLYLCRRSLLFFVSVVSRRLLNHASALQRMRAFAAGGFQTVLFAGMELASTLPLAGINLDAILRALYRLGVDRSRSLEWTTNSQSSREVHGRSSLMLPELWRAAGLALLIAGTLALKNPGALPWAAPVLVSWIPMVFLVRRSRAPSSTEDGATAELRALARQCWALHEQHASRVAPSPDGVAELTPVDAALGLLTPLSAYHLGCLEAPELEPRLAEALALIESLERFRGHLYARYDARTRRPLEPASISTSESGMLAAALLSIESALHAMRLAGRASAVSLDEGGAARLEALEGRAHVLREAMDFTFLHDASMGLFHVGYDVAARTPSAGHHDELASAGLLAGFIAVAQRQVPLRHWRALLESHMRVRAPGTARAPPPADEQLSPFVFLDSPPATLLGDAARSGVDARLEAETPVHVQALTLRFNARDAGARLQRSLSALPEVPRRSLGMALLALTNAACDDILVQQFHQHWRTAWLEALVYETKEAP